MSRSLFLLTLPFQLRVSLVVYLRVTSILVLHFVSVFVDCDIRLLRYIYVWGLADIIYSAGDSCSRSVRRIPPS